MRYPIIRSLFAAAVLASISYAQENLPARRQADPPLIDVKSLAPRIVVDMRYATADNFTKHKLYPVADQCLLCEPAARRLAEVQASLEKKGLGLKVWDCYRPISVQKKLWEIMPNPDYVADPKTGSRHNRGASVDLTLVDAQGRELLMPTPFDEFSDKAHRDYMDLPSEAIKNRQTLQDAMAAAGFLPLPTEWWHFDSPEWSSYALRDEPLGSASLKEEKMTANIPSDTSQMLVVTSKNWTDASGTLQRFERTGTVWKKLGSTWPVSLGLKGMIQDKKEGDNKSPAGVFRLGKAYGYAPSAPVGSRWPYQQVDEKWRCVDDPSSARYNQIFPVDGSLKKDWKSAELMKRNDHLYKWVINIEQNVPVVSGCGSCIFLHVWRKPGSGTEGCTAMDESNMVELLKWLDPARKPVIVQSPEGVIQIP